jgi:putative endonuclease
MSVYYVYVLKSKKDGKLYTGCTANLRKRLNEHSDGNNRSTRYRIPFELVYYEASRNNVDALHREKYLKTTYGKRYLKNRLKGDIISQGGRGCRSH